MPVSNDIFELVKGMNRRERSFFKRYLQMHSAGKSSDLLILYDSLVNYSRDAKNYDEDEFRKKTTAGKIKHFPVVKNNLYNLILKSLNEFSGETTNESRVKNLVEQSDILFSRSLLKQSQSALKRAKKIAEENEMFLYIHTILSKERKLARYTLSAGEYESEIDRIYSSFNQNLEKLKNLTDMNDLGSRFTLMIQKYPTSMARDEAALNETRKITEHPLLKDEKLMLSDTTRKKFYNLKIIASEWEKDYHASLGYAMKYTALVEDELKTGKASKHELIISLYSVLVQTVRASAYAEYESAYEKMENIPLIYKNLTERDRSELNYYKGISVFSVGADGFYTERGNEMLKEAEENSALYERTLSMQQKIIWYFVIARFCYFKNEFTLSSKWLNRLIAMPNADLSQDYQCYARIMNIIVAYESGNPDMIEHALRKGFYFLAKRNKIYSYEKIILDYVKQAFRVKTEREITEMLEFMYRDLTKIKDDPFESNAFDAFNILPWLERKTGR